MQTVSNKRSNVRFNKNHVSKEYADDARNTYVEEIAEGSNDMHHITPWIIGNAIESWFEQRGPYINVWPTVFKSLLNTNMALSLDMIPKSVVHDLGVMEVRTPIDSGIPSFFIVIASKLAKKDLTNGHDHAFFFCVHSETPVSSGDADATFIALPFHKPLEEFNDEWFEKNKTFDSLDTDDIPDTEDSTKKIHRLAAGVMLLAADPNYCTPVLLNRDKDKVLTPEAHALAVDRARRNGNHGFDLGASIEMSPHFRRPHFSVRWTGPGGKIPRLVPVKGSVINRKLLTEIPSGYELDDQENSDRERSDNVRPPEVV